MKVDPKKTPFRYSYRGRVYYFCSDKCLKEFRSNPEKYVKRVQLHGSDEENVHSKGSVRVRIEKTGEETYLMQIVRLVREAQEIRSRTQDLADKAAFWLTIIAIVLGTSTLVSWLYLTGDFAFALERMVTVMVITCPHALGLAVPLVVAVSTSLSARKGILIRNRRAFERIKDLDAVVFDKTGTLTEGAFEVVSVVSFADLSEDEVLRYAASLEAGSEHPIAAGIVEKAKTKGWSSSRWKSLRLYPAKASRELLTERT